MDIFQQSQTFFLISSIGFAIIGILVIILLFYLIGSIVIFYKIVKKLEKNIDKIGDTAKSLLEDVRYSTVLNFLFKKKKKHYKD